MAGWRLRLQQKFLMRMDKLHSEILASYKFKNNLNLFPLIGQQPSNQMLFQLFFQPNHICQGCCKIVGPTFQCIVVLQPRGEGPDSC